MTLTEVWLSFCKECINLIEVCMDKFLFGVGCFLQSVAQFDRGVGDFNWDVAKFLQGVCEFN